MANAQATRSPSRPYVAYGTNPLTSPPFPLYDGYDGHRLALYKAGIEQHCTYLEEDEFDIYEEVINEVIGNAELPEDTDEAIEYCGPAVRAKRVGDYLVLEMHDIGITVCSPINASIH